MHSHAKEKFLDWTLRTLSKRVLQTFVLCLIFCACTATPERSSLIELCERYQSERCKHLFLDWSSVHAQPRRREYPWLNFANFYRSEKKRQHTTMGFVQVRLRVVAIGINNIAAFVRAWPTSPKIGSKYLSLSKAGQRLRAEGMLMPHLHKALSLCDTNLTHFKKSTFLFLFISCFKP